MAEPDHSSASTSGSSTSRDSSGAGAASSISSLNPSPVTEEEEETHHNHDAHRFGPSELEHQNFGFAYRGNFSAFDDASPVVSDDTWSCIIVVLTFWFFG